MMASIRTTLLDPGYRTLLVLLSLGFFVAYALLDLREGGRSSNLLTTRMANPSFYIEHFGGWFFWGSVVLNAALAVCSALLIAVSVSGYQERKAMAGGVCTTSVTLLLGFAVFGCPGCMMPLFGTLGIAVFANALPLFGLEFKLLSLAVTLGALAWLGRRRDASLAASSRTHREPASARRAY